MKNVYMLLIAAIFCGTMAKAQELDYGINVGFNYYSYFSENNSGDLELAETSMSTNLQYHLGGYLDVPVDSDFGLVTNIAYQNRSVQLPEDQDTRLNYLDFQPLFKYNFSGSYGRGAYVKAGARYSVLLNAKLFDDLQDVSEGFNKSNFGLDLGVGYDITPTFAVELMFDYSPSDFSEDIQSQLIGIDFGFLIDLNDLLTS